MQQSSYDRKKVCPYFALNMNSSGNNDLFREEFKYFKRRAIRPDLSKVIDFERPDDFPVKVHSWLQTTPDCRDVGLVTDAELICYSVPANPGLLVLPNPFTPLGQRIWVSRTLRSYPNPPNVTNLKALRPPAAFPASPADDPFYKDLSCLRKLVKKLATLIGYPGLEPEAAIVNYYAMNSTLSGHVDHSELDLESPLFSVSFGQTAVFLIGGRTKDVRPTAMFLRSGDVVVMTGESRLAYHAVPLVLSREDDAPWCVAAEECGVDGAVGDWDAEARYLSNHRINLNVRQVFAKS
ncbi:alpha-ketoglutarate-dependent dioxygenase AlkB isoform X2 [Haemaphysalis longicornis]